MKIRELNRELKAICYQLLTKRGRSSHRIFQDFQTYYAIALSVKNHQDAQPARLKLIK